MTTGVQRRAVLCAAAAAAALPAAAFAAAEVAAIDRPALTARQPQRSVLLAAALAGSTVVAVGERGIVLLSGDASKTWRQAPVPVSVTLTGVRFADERTGYAVGHGGVVIATTDGGATWTRHTDGRALAQVVLAQARASGDAAAVRSAERLVAEGADKPLTDLLVAPNRLVVTGSYGLTFESADGGQSWQSWADRLDNPKGAHLYALRARGDTLLLAGEQGLVLLSTDAGRSFKSLETPYKGSFFTAELPADGTLFVAGLRGNAWSSPDQGRTWSQLRTPMPTTFTGSALAADGGVVLANQAGFVFARRGTDLVPLNTTPAPATNALLLTRAGWLALTMQGAVQIQSAESARP